MFWEHTWVFLLQVEVLVSHCHHFWHSPGWNSVLFLSPNHDVPTPHKIAFVLNDSFVLFQLTFLHYFFPTEISLHHNIKHFVLVFPCLPVPIHRGGFGLRAVLWHEIMRLRLYSLQWVLFSSFSCLYKLMQAGSVRRDFSCYLHLLVQMYSSCRTSIKM